MKIETSMDEALIKSHRYVEIMQKGRLASDKERKWAKAYRESITL